MRASRTVVNRLLDEDDASVTLATLARASLAIGAPLIIEFATNEATGNDYKCGATPHPQDWPPAGDI